MSSFIAAGSAYATHGINTIPFFIFYSMFGLQRVCDLIWAAADTRCRGFLLGGTAGRTTLAGEGLQHQDGNSHVLALPIPTLQAYDPAFAYELAVIIEDGIERMYNKGESIFYYITVMNEPYAMPQMPPGSREGILKGMYKYRAASDSKSKLRAQLFGSGSILREVLRAQEILAEKYHVAADVWSVTSYKALYSDGKTARAICVSVPDRESRGTCGRHGLFESAAESGEPMDAPPAGLAGYRRFWPKREQRIPSQLFRSGRALCRSGDAPRVAAGGENPGFRGRAGDQRSRD
jgi:pyruvate dehydrogenase E1 component